MQTESRNHVAEEKSVFEGGAQSSKLDLRYDLIPPEAETALAARLALGSSKYSDDNWKKGGKDFVKARLNHLKRHVNHLVATQGVSEDDDVGALLCNASFLAWYRVHKPEAFFAALSELAGAAHFEANKKPPAEAEGKDASGLILSV